MAGSGVQSSTFQNDKNPFMDPSVTQLMNPQVSTNVSSFNPFSEESASRQEPVYQTNHQDLVKSATEDLKRQQESLEQTAYRIENSEPNLQNRTIHQAAIAERINNYPPLPPCCPCKPCFYQNIELEILPEHQRIVRFHFYFWIAYSFQLLINVAGCLAFFTVAKDKFNESISFGVSIGYFFVFIPCSYACWFRPLYKAFRSDSSLNFFWYFVVFFSQICILVIDSLGIIYYGTVGWINGFSCFGAGLYEIGIFMVVIGAIFDILAIIGFILMAKVNFMYRRSGASLERARLELNQNIANNNIVQRTTVGAARRTTQLVEDGVFANSPY